MDSSQSESPTITITTNTTNQDAYEDRFKVKEESKSDTKEEEKEQKIEVQSIPNVFNREIVYKCLEKHANYECRLLEEGIKQASVSLKMKLSKEAIIAFEKYKQSAKSSKSFNEYEICFRKLRAVLRSNPEFFLAMDGFITSQIYRECQEIIPGLFIGSEWSARDLDQLHEKQISHIVTLTNLAQATFPLNFHYLKIDIEDSASSKLYLWFPKCNEFIDRAICEEQGRVLVHCEQGLSRSATICIAYCMGKYRLGYEDARALVRRARPIIEPNEGFVSQLLIFQDTLKKFERLEADIPEPSTPPATEKRTPTSSKISLSEFQQSSPLATPKKEKEKPGKKRLSGRKCIIL